MKKLGIIGAIIVVLFAALIVLTKIANDSDSKNKTDKDASNTGSSNQVLIDLENDKNYQNIISPNDLEEKIASGETVIAYFFSPECIHCKAMTPALMPIAEEVGVHVDQYNILENQQGWDDYNVEATPTLVYFKDGKEVNRIVGDYSGDTDTIHDFLEQVK